MNKLSPEMDHTRTLVIVFPALLVSLLGCDFASIHRARSSEGDETRSNGIASRQQQHVALDAGLADDEKQDLDDSAPASRALTGAPAELRDIVVQYETDVEFRNVPHVAGDVYSGGCHGRMALREDVLNAHVEQFKLQRTSSGPRTEKLLRYFTTDWPDITTADIQWYAWHYNRDDGSNLQLWSVMAIDRDESMLYFFWQNYDVTP